jgi:2-polyprenyl-3-methyl-5-hydroxy-6-metoxy-1,4-benzoquinol methylase
MRCRAKVGRLFNESLSWIHENYPAIAGGLLSKERPDGPALVEVAERVLGFYLRNVGEDRTRLHGALDAVAMLSFDFLRLQSRFMKSGKYRSSSAREIREKIYQNPDRMEGTYLDGLFLTYAFWPNHTMILRFFEQNALPLPANGSNVLEIGAGHGLMGLLMLKARPSMHYTGMDISSSSITYARRMLTSNGIALDGISLLEADASMPGVLGQKCDMVVCSEVLEHVEDPAALLHGMGGVLDRGGLAFVTTVANIEAEDHIYLFESFDHIRDFINTAGFDVKHELPLELKGFEQSSIKPYNYAALLAWRGGGA